MRKHSYFTECPRCGEESFEHLKTYAHCPNCLYYEDYWESSEALVLDAMKQERIVDEMTNQKAKLEDTIKKCREANSYRTRAASHLTLLRKLDSRAS